MSEKILAQILEMAKAAYGLVRTRAVRNPRRKDQVTKALCRIVFAGLAFMTAIVVCLFLCLFVQGFPVNKLDNQATLLAVLIFVGGLIIVIVAAVSLSGIFQSMEDGEREDITILTKPVVSNRLAEIIKRGFEEPTVLERNHKKWYE